MAIAQSLLPEFDQEMANTRKTLERVPDGKFAWKPHDKSGTMGWLAGHVAMLPGWIPITFSQDSLDINPPGGSDFKPPRIEDRADLLAVFDKNVSEARKTLSSTTDEQMMRPWTLLSAGNKIFTIPKAGVVRSFVLNHLIHHRAQLTIYLRLNNVPVPALYGPSADEGSF